MKTITKGEGQPQYTVVGSIHGDEPAGKKAIEKILSSDIEFKKPVKFIIANEKALEQNKRYLEKDLNRAMPGNPESDIHEERLAHKLKQEVEGTKLLDIHTTRSHPEPFATFKSKEKDVIELISAANVQNGVYFSDNSGTLIGQIEKGIIVEAGYQQTDQAIENSVEVIKNFLGYFGVIDYDYQTSEPNLFEYLETVEGNWEFKAQNFKLVKKGETYAEKNGEKLTAEEDFYPVLMSTNGYEGKLGYKAKKLELNY